MGISTKIITSAEEVRAISTRWQTLLNSSDADTLFLTPEWVLTWLSVTRPDIRLFIILVYNDKKLIGLAPFYFSTLRVFGYFRFSCLRILADQNTSSEYQDIVVHREYPNLALESIASTLMAHRNRFTFFWIPYTNVVSGASTRFETLFSRMNYAFASRSFEYYSIDLPASFEEFQARLKTKQRNNIRRYTKKLQVASPLSFSNLANSSAEEAFVVLTRLHAQHWNHLGEQGVFERKPAFKNFIRAYSVIAQNTHRLAALCLYQGDDAIAIRYGFIYKKVLYEIQAGFNPHLNGSGIIAINKSIEYAIEKGLSAYDFLAFAGDYKRKFSARPTIGRNYFAGNSSLFSKLIFHIGLWPTGRYISHEAL